MDRIFRAIFGLFSFETLFVLYLFAGQYKKDKVLMHLTGSVDLTPVLFVASAAVGLFIFIVKGLEIKKQTYRLLFTFLLFVCYAGISLSWSASSVYGATKTLYLGFQNFWNLIAAAIIIVPDRRRLRRLMFMILVVSFIYVIMSLPLIMKAGSGLPINLVGTEYDGVSFVISTGIPVLLCYMIDISQKKFIRMLSFTLCCLYFLILLYVGHRGYLISTIIGMILLIYISFRDQLSAVKNISIKKSHIILILLALFTTIAIMHITGNEPVTVSRMELLEAPTQHGSTSLRLHFYREAFHIWGEHPIFGAGIGSFPIINGAGDVRGYPHNLILELLSELGLVGLLIFGTLLFIGVRSLLKNLFSKSPESFFVLLIFVTYFVESLFSSDISDHRFLMLALGLMMFPPAPTRSPVSTPAPAQVGLLTEAGEMAADKLSKVNI